MRATKGASSSHGEEGSMSDEQRTDSALHEEGDPPVGSRLWRCEQELEKARKEVLRLENSLSLERDQLRRTAGHWQKAEQRSETPEPCKHETPLVLSAAISWCPYCGALGGLNRWRLPQPRSGEASPTKPRTAMVGGYAPNGTEPNNRAVEVERKRAEDEAQLRETYGKPAPNRWRVGRKNPRALWYGEDTFHGVLDSVQVVARVVALLNADRDVKPENVPAEADPLYTWVDTKRVQLVGSFGLGAFDPEDWDDHRIEYHTPEGSWAVWRTLTGWSLYGPREVCHYDRYGSRRDAQAAVEQLAPRRERAKDCCPTEELSHFPGCKLLASLRSARDQLTEAKIEIGKLRAALLPFAEHGQPAYWRDRSTGDEVSVAAGELDHVLFVSDLLRAHAIYFEQRTAKATNGGGE